MLTKISPKSVYLPIPNYVGATLVEPGARTIYISGQVGIDHDGSCPDGIGEQTAIAFDNIFRTLEEVGMSADNIVKLNFFIKEGQDVDEVRAARNERMNMVPVASTIVYISGLVQDNLLVEIDCIAAG